MGRELPEHPTLFAKFARALIGAYDDDRAAGRVASRSTGRPSSASSSAPRSGTPRRSEAAAAIAGYTVLNDVTARDWQYRTPQWLQGKTFEAQHPGRAVAGHPRRRRPCPASSRCERRRRADAEGRHRRPRLRPGRAGRVRVHDHHAGARRHHRHRHPGRRRPRPQAPALPRRRARPSSPGSRASASCATSAVKGA